MEESPEASKAFQIFPSIPEGLSALPNCWDPGDNPECMCTYRYTRANIYTRYTRLSVYDQLGPVCIQSYCKALQPLFY